MSQRPYPNTDRALHQLGRHTSPATLPLPGLTFAEAAANLASWGRAGKLTFDFIASAYAHRPTLSRHQAALAWLADVTATRR